MYNNLPKWLAKDKQDGTLKLFLDGSYSWTTAYDVSWQGNNWTLTNTPVFTRKMWWKWWTYTSWSSQYITFWNIFPNWTWDWSHCCWVKRNTDWTQNRIMSKQPASWVWFIFSMRGDNSIWYWFTDSWSNTNMFQTSTNVITADWKWHFVCWTKTWQSVKVYIDWTLCSWTLVSTSNYNADAWTEPFYIWRYAQWEYANSSIINPMVFSRALTQTEINELMYSQGEIAFT